MARSKKEPGFWTALVTEAQASTESLAAVAAKHSVTQAALAAVAAKHSVTQAALRYHFYKRKKPTEGTNKAVPMLPVRVEGDSRLFSVEIDGSLRLRFAEGCDPGTSRPRSPSCVKLVLSLTPSVRIYLAIEPVGLRRGHDGRSAIIRGQWGASLFAGHLFVFLGRRRDRCKILFWDRGGLVLY